MSKKTLPKLKLAAVQDMAGNLPRGLRRPLHTVTNDKFESAVIDADGKTLFVTSLGVASMAATAINAYPGLTAGAAAMEVSLRALRMKLRSLPRTPTIAELMAIVDVGLAETDEHEDAEPM